MLVENLKHRKDSLSAPPKTFPKNKAIAVLVFNVPH